MKTININFLITGTKITFPFSAICSITDKRFSGSVIIEYRPNKKVIEYVDAERTVKKIVKSRLTVEELAHKIFKKTKENISPKYLKVLVDAQKSEAHRPVQVWIEQEFK